MTVAGIREGVPAGPVVAQPSLGDQLIQAIGKVEEILQQEEAKYIPAELLGRALVMSLEKGLMPYSLRILSLSTADEIPGQGEWGLGHALCIACEKSSEVCKIILSLRNVDNIPLSGKWGLGDALIQTIKGKKGSIFQKIVAHARFSQIVTTSDRGLNACFKAYLENLRNGRLHAKDTCKAQYGDNHFAEPAYFQAFVDHPQARQLEIAPKYFSGLLFLIASGLRRWNLTKTDKALIALLLRPSVAHLIQSNGEYGLGRALVYAAYSLTPTVVSAILAHPKSSQIVSEKTKTKERDHLQEEYENLSCYGLTEAIYVATKPDWFYRVKDSDRPRWKSKRITIAEALVKFATQHQIRLNINAPCGIADSLTQAAGDDESLVLIILSAVSPDQPITPNVNKDKGGLSSALRAAASVAHINAVKAILAQPNARSISKENLKIAEKKAQAGFDAIKDSEPAEEKAFKASYRAIVDTIQNFIKTLDESQGNKS